MKKMTEEFIKNAFAGESMAHMKYLNFATKAEKEGFPNVARLFRGIAYAEEVHASNHFRMVLKEVKSTSENLEAAKGGEDFEINEMYAAYKVVAELQEEKTALKSINFALEAEKIHSSMYGDAKDKVDSGKDIELTTLYICPVCGWTSEQAEDPDKCPVCGFIGEYAKF